MWDLNVMGVVHAAQAVLPGMTGRGRGRIVAVAATAGLEGYPYVTACCAAKHAPHATGRDEPPCQRRHPADVRLPAGEFLLAVEGPVATVTLDRPDRKTRSPRELPRADRLLLSLRQ